MRTGASNTLPLVRAATLLAGVLVLLAACLWLLSAQPCRKMQMLGRCFDQETQASWRTLLRSPDAPALDVRSALLIADIERINRRSLSWLRSADEAELGEEAITLPRDLTVYQPSAWRPVLWRAVFPRAYKAGGIKTAIDKITAHVAARIRVAPKEVGPTNILSIWEEGRADRQGLAVVTVAALQSVGIPARLAAGGTVEVSLDGKWTPARDFARCYEILEQAPMP
jgi:hypothetical protein